MIDKQEQINEEYQRLKEDLEDLEKYIKDFSSFLPLAICTINPLKIIIDTNKSFEKLAGYDSLTIIGQSIENIFSEKRSLNIILSSVQKERIVKNKEFTLISNNKKKIPVSVSISVREDDKKNIIGYFLALTDITETKKAREGLEEKVEKRTEELDNSRKALMNMLEDVEESRRKAEEEKNKTASIVSNLSDGLLVFDNKNKSFLINSQTEKFLALTSEDLIGKTIEDLGKVEKIKPLMKILNNEKREYLERK